MSAVDEIIAGLDQPASNGATDPSADEPTSRNLPGTFWDARPSLTLIRQAAHSRGRSADAVLGATLARAVARVSPDLTLPAIVGSAGSLNLAVGVVARSGAGKSTAAAIASELVEISAPEIIDSLPIGSGEGLIEAYFGTVAETDDEGNRVKVRRQVHTGLVAYLDEGQALAEQGHRKGSTLLPTIRSAWSGSVLGQANASTDRDRRLPAHAYRCCIVVGWQATHAAPVIGDAASGTPQRFLWLSAVDATVPNEPPEWPGWSPPTVGRIDGPRIMDVPSDVEAEVRAADLARTRGVIEDPDPLDSHRMLSRLKVAAALAILEGRLDIELEDWGLAGMVIDTSDAVRSGVIATARIEAAERERADNRKAARRDAHLEASAEERAVDTMAAAIARHVHRAKHDCRRRCMTQTTSGKHRQHASIDDAIARALDAGWISESDDGTYTAGQARP